MKDKLLKWRNETQELTHMFVIHYFGRDAVSYWVSDEIGDVLCVNDYFFNLSEITNFIHYRYSKNKMFEYCDYALKCAVEGKNTVTIKNYRHLITN